MIERYTLPKMSGIWSEESKFARMLDVEIAVCEAWAKDGKIPKKSLQNIKSKAKIDIVRIKEIEERTHHDVVAFVNDLSESLGRDAQYIHKGLTSNDVIDTALGLQLRDACDVLIEDLDRLIAVLGAAARKYRSIPCMGRTHGIHAEPITFGLKVALWYDEMRRHRQIMTDAKKLVAVGKLSGAVGSYSNIEPEIEAFVCQKLGLGVALGSTQVVSRDRHAILLARIAIVGASLEKFATEIRHLQRTEVAEVEEPFAKGQKGSSAMPHKRNPVKCERIAGLARLLRADALAAMENVALWHERDISHSSVERVILPDATTLLDYMLCQFTAVMEGLQVYPKIMAANIGRTRGLIYSQRVLLELMKKGMTRQAAYDIVQKNAFEAQNSHREFQDLLAGDPKVKRYLSSSELAACFDIHHYLRNIPKIMKALGLG